MGNSNKAARLIIEDMSASDMAALYKWIGKLLPKQAEAETPTLSSAALWWRAKLKSGNVLPGIGWPTTLLIGDLVEDYIEAIKRNITRRGISTSMGRFLKTVGAVEEKKPSRKGKVTIRAGEPDSKGFKPGVDGVINKRIRYYVFHELGKCREGFEVKYGPQDWGDSGGSGGSGDDAQNGAFAIP